MTSYILLLVLLLIVHLGSTDADGESAETKDAIEGQEIQLECRFNPMQRNFNNFVFYWHRSNETKTSLVAIKTNSLSTDYKVDFDLNQGKFDLRISNANYERDNGKFECKIQEEGSGADYMSRNFVVTILKRPSRPLITPSTFIAKEGEPYRLNCSSIGGSPDPIVKWYRNDISVEGEFINGGTRNKPTSNILMIDPTKDLDGTNYRCTVWNRAMGGDGEYEAYFTLRVHYKPRIRVGPYNPLNVLSDENAEMSCNVDANPPVNSIKWMKGNSIISTSNNHTILRVNPTDSGSYDCIAENGISGPVKETLTLSVLQGPQITLDSFKEATAGENVKVSCDIVSNPSPHTIVWLKENDDIFKQTGPVLSIKAITADNIGNYICKATATLIKSGASTGIEKSSNATVQLQIKHKPGQTYINPSNPVVVAGHGFTLNCGANPPGYPAPEYEWWREGQDKNERKIGTRPNYTTIAHINEEGRYFCQPVNSHGKGTLASVFLTVNEQAQVVHPMKPSYEHKTSESNIKLTCIGKGKPRPNISWTHNDQEISPEKGKFRVENKEQNEDAAVKTITTTLYFEGMERNGVNSISAEDRGRYACHFDNGIEKPAKSETILRVWHTPQVRHSYNRVAFDVNEKALLVCKMSAFPAPKFVWYFGGKELESSVTSGEKYSFNTSELIDDIYQGTLTISQIRESDYGDYTCQASNSAGADDKKTIIKLVKKSPPETPSGLQALDVVSDSVNLQWKEGFNGGFANTEFVVNYNDGAVAKNESCRTMNPCKITGLESRHEYQFRVLAVNLRGSSQYSESLKVVTKVNLKDMPSAFESSYDRERNVLNFKVDPKDVPLRLVGKVEIRSEATEHWTPLTSLQIISDIENVYLKSTAEQITDIRVILCLQSNETWCGYPHLVKLDSAYSREPKTVATDHLFGVIIVSIACAAIGIIALLCCCLKKKEKPEKKDFESDTSNERPNKVIGQNYYSSHDNKGLMSDMDSANMNKLAAGIYGSNLGTMSGHIPQNYYLTGDGNSDPSPNGSNETAQTEFWHSMKSNMHLHDNLSPESELNYNAGYNMMNNQLIEPGGYMSSYSYYPTQGYQPLDEESLSRKNNLNMYYDEMNGNGYGGPMTIDMMTGEALKTNAKMQLAYQSDDVDYPTSRARVMSEIIV